MTKPIKRPWQIASEPDPALRPGDYEYQSHGYSLRSTRRGISVFELDYWADPAKDNEKFKLDHINTQGAQNFRREYLRDWAAASGTRFYPEFDPALYVHRAQAMLDAPVIRGWDFGKRHPALVCLQRSPISGRVWVLRELMPTGMDIYNFRDLVMYACGQMDIDELHQRDRKKALAFVNWYKASEGWQGARLPPMPWFPPGTPFIDFAGHEAVMSSAFISQEKEEATYADVLALEKIQLGWSKSLVANRATVFHSLLGMRRVEGSEALVPNLLVDPACPILIGGLSGGITFAKPTINNPNPEVPAKDGWFEHVHEATGYALINVCSVKEGGTGKAAPAKSTGRLRSVSFRVEPEGEEGGEAESSLLENWK